MLSAIANMIWVRAKEKGLESHMDVDRKIPSQLPETAFRRNRKCRGYTSVLYRSYFAKWLA